MFEGEIPPLDAGRRVKARRNDARDMKVKKIRIMKRLRDSTGTSPETVRNRVILQEMRRSYNQLTGVGLVTAVEKGLPLAKIQMPTNYVPVLLAVVDAASLLKGNGGSPSGTFSSYHSSPVMIRGWPPGQFP